MFTSKTQAVLVVWFLVMTMTFHGRDLRTWSLGTCCGSYWASAPSPWLFTVVVVLILLCIFPTVAVVEHYNC